MSSSNSSENSEGSGNTILTPLKQISPAKRWVFTWNNYTSTDSSNILQLFNIVADKYIFGEEIGESGTPHLQGYVEFKKKCRPLSIDSSFKKAHWEKAKGNLISNAIYCSKGSNIHKLNIIVPKEIKIINPIFKWQLNILDIIKNYTEDRKINWFWEEKGGIGKTEFCRYLVVKHNAIILGGKGSDMKYAVLEYVKAHGSYPELIVFDIPRSSRSWLSYTGIEEIKNALFFSNKYEAKQCVGNKPCVLVFANFEPDYDNLSKDRWNVVDISEKVKTIKVPVVRAEIPFGPSLQ